MPAGRVGPTQAAAALADLRSRGVNYDPARAPGGARPEGHWHLDATETVIAREPAGAPVPGGPWERACRLVGRYEFTDPAIVRAVYRRGENLLGRDMLLEGRFFGLRFYLGVRVTAVIEETRGVDSAAQQVCGWSYQTLEGHLEQGRLSYEVIKYLGSGDVSFRLSGYSRPAPIPNPVVRCGFGLFGRWTQERFYRGAQARLGDLADASGYRAPLPEPAVRADGLVFVPTGSSFRGPTRLARGSRHPGR